mmetsp:Transcript_21957/g.32885  ORF Transcript_21957/g.32885 Transcript_21957/m.32885 type:complete len:459 (+) Transcript_21957:109-1485(+)|eukprot:CAMPEP_0203662660 /NCGR_PEP_ID=MMETSP0090-20130426/552_1 /ASSEMBLY_ACC=CAM_ASM_001088 /TAXON_ID=426623 /ORGANISM="Chaetoceros affinis, Strain CCMP159" /LENGTH=458 /DNA_ID=CAMNT_0050525485 /DNA_START=96 /DNA_END=1475 /DNA_ORIENTATION=-
MATKESEYGSILHPTEEQNDTGHGRSHEEEDEEEDPKVTTLELFSDLVMVVSVHAVAEPLEEEHSFKSFGTYLARVFYLWLAWHMITLFMNASVKQKANNCPFFNLFLFLWMAVITQMAKAFAGNEDCSAAKWYLFLRIFETLIFTRQVYYPYKAIQMEDGTRKLAVDEEWVISSQKYSRLLIVNLFLFEILPLSTAIYLGDGKNLYAPAVLFSVVSISLSFTVGAVDFGFMNNVSITMEDAFDTQHLQERYELITLIFTGELCFAAGKRGNALASTSVLVFAFAAYLLTFKSAPQKGHQKFWKRTILHSVVGLLLYAGVFCAIPAIGSAYATIINSDAEEIEEGEGVGNEEEKGEGDSGGIPTTGLLCYSAGAFMTFTACMNLINDESDKIGEVKLFLWKRGVIRFCAGVIIFMLPYLFPDDVILEGAPIVAIIVPFLAVFSASIEIWATGSLKVAL